MSLVSAVNMYFDNLVEPMFQRDEHGRGLFYPMGMGFRGRVVPDEATGARLRLALRTGYQVLFFGIMPVCAGLQAVMPADAISIWAFIAGAVGMQLAFTTWVARGLATTDRRMNLANQTASIAATHSARYIQSMAVLSAILTLGGVAAIFMPAVAASQPDWGQPMAIASALFFAAMTAMWVRILKAKRRQKA